MNTATAPATEQFDGFIAQKRPETSINPHEDRFAYIPPVVSAASDPRTTGYAFFIPGTLITFRTFNSGGWPNPDFLENANARGLTREFSAELAAKNSAINYASIEGHDVGYAPLPMLTGKHNARQYFDALHPVFDALGYQCPYGLKECPTCRSQWLESEPSKAYFNDHSDGLDRDLALEVKTALYESNQRFLEFCKTTWGQLSDAYERTRGKENPFVMDATHHHYRKCLHQMTFEEREMEKIRTMAGSNAAAIGEAVRGAGGGAPTGFTDEELAEIYAKRAAKAKAESKAAPKANLADTSDAPAAVTSDDGSFEVGDAVLCDGEPGIVTEVTANGWFVVNLDDADETKKVRKGQLQKEQNA